MDVNQINTRGKIKYFISLLIITEYERQEHISRNILWIRQTEFKILDSDQRQKCDFSCDLSFRRFFKLNSLWHKWVIKKTPWVRGQFMVLLGSTNIRLYKLTLSRIMSISEYFIPLTSTGVSLERKQEEKWWEQRARTGRSQQAIAHIWSLLWSQFNVTVWWQMLQLRSTSRDLNQPSWGVEEEYHSGTRSAVTYSQGCYESTAFNIGTGVSACTVCTFVYMCVCVCVCVLTGRDVHTAPPYTPAAQPE